MAQSKIELTPEMVTEAVKRVMASLGQTQPATGNPSGSAGTLDAKKDFPLATKRPDLVRSASGMQLSDITLAKVTAGEIQFEDIKIRPETLEYQAQIAESVGRPRLAANMRRAAEMTRISDERLLEMYNALRPYRSTKQEMLAMADELESKYQAFTCAALVREAAAVYEQRGRLKK